MDLVMIVIAMALFTTWIATALSLGLVIIVKCVILITEDLE
jgi:hypothetical protein